MRAFTLMVLGVVASSLLMPGAEARSRRPDCLRTGHTVVANGKVRVFYRGDPKGHVLYACWMRTRRVREIGETFGYGADTYGMEDVTLAGRHVAFSTFTSDRLGDIAAGVEVRDARSGRVVSREPERVGRSISDLVVIRAGVAAYIEHDATGTRVVMLRASQRSVLDEAAGVERGSLAIAGNRAYWMRGGQPITAVLTPPER